MSLAAMPGSIVLENSASGNVPLMLAALAGAMYWLGGAHYRAACSMGRIDARRRRLERWRTLSFTTGLVILVLALQQPMDAIADEYFWAHMCQHVLLLVVVPPLMLLAAPWMRLWRGFPLGFRRPVARWVVRDRAAAPLRGLARLLGNPWVIFTVMSIDLIAWHIPAAYDQTLKSVAVHYTEHATFLIFGLLAWGQVIDSPPFHSRLDAPRRIVFATGQMVVGWALAMLLAFASNPWYPFYAHLRQRNGGISELTDQHLAAGVMWVPASLPWSVLIFMLLYGWLSDGERPRPPQELARLIAGNGHPPGNGRVPGGHPEPAWPFAGPSHNGQPKAPARPAPTVKAAGASDHAVSTDRRIHA